MLVNKGFDLSLPSWHLTYLFLSSKSVRCISIHQLTPNLPVSILKICQCSSNRNWYLNPRTQFFPGNDSTLPIHSGDNKSSPSPLLGLHYQQPTNPIERTIFKANIKVHEKLLKKSLPELIVLLSLASVSVNANILASTKVSAVFLSSWVCCGQSYIRWSRLPHR